ncbi:peptidoglycan DD-metalloendopeptidase family protein [Vibrio sp. CAU 1672]|uniref:peptidoglycan DD-metalloendopeptidase family protein n=1 Tax=Vibrio sp. CAU 1672 TaxID=3032594 RepID=UPI0023DC5312|nr:peptidoglycan DD-metalloendopeptidase family protein [Vibrio sp. CAU 1672]MDF2154137.1 peptidoglycan DD-metalloendopeptidase family protein [Vibrio sp. CAU 1672]
MKWGLRRFGLSMMLAAGLVGCAAHSPAPVSSLNKDYSSVERGSYRGSYYEVQKGDTLYFIAYITDKDVNDLVSYNDLSGSYTIFPGQKLKLWAPAYNAPKYGKTAAPVIPPKVVKVPPPVSKPATSATGQKSSKNSSAKPKPSQAKVAQKQPIKKVEQSQTKEYVGSKGKQNVKPKAPTSTANNDKVSKWLWPTKGRVIKSFSAGEQGNKGIDIAGQRGQSIVSTAPGTVVYSGNALRGYGNLIIVKHNENYLSAYAHNDRLLVNEGQNVKAGQKIATMGSSGTKSVKLHFEIRYQGKSVNPKRYLP